MNSIEQQAQGFVNDNLETTAEQIAAAYTEMFGRAVSVAEVKETATQELYARFAISEIITRNDQLIGPERQQISQWLTSGVEMHWPPEERLKILGVSDDTMPTVWPFYKYANDPSQAPGHQYARAFGRAISGISSLRNGN